ncbi:MAG: GTP1/OBG family GTP-binding protein [Thermoprotei archaeon]|nr:MAG: GTP1/OBG family GTP-binding protein [Thermoprotei archaeon]
MEQPFSKLPEVPRSQELLDIAFSRAMRRGVKAPRRMPRDLRVRMREEARITSAGYIIINKLDRVLSETPRLDSLHPFYRELADVIVGMDRLKKALARLQKAKEIVSKLIREHLKALRRTTEPRQALRIRRAFFGRVSSVVEELDEDLSLLKDSYVKLRRLPSIDPEGTTIVVAGAPNVGKSSFIRCVSTAKPEVASYPFTTRQVLVGHLKVDGIRVQVLDTPGLLDRPLSERKPSELQAIAALKHLARSAIFIIDPSEASGYTINEQLNVFNEVINFLGDTPCIPVLNKVDLATENKIEQVEKAVGKRLPRMVAYRCIGVKEVLDMAIRAAGVLGR